MISEIYQFHLNFSHGVLLLRLLEICFSKIRRTVRYRIYIRIWGVFVCFSVVLSCSACVQQKTEKILKTFKDVTTADCAESHEYTEVNFDVTITKNN